MYFFDESPEGGGEEGTLFFRPYLYKVEIPKI